MPRRKSASNKPPSSLTLAVVAATFAVLGYIGISYITNSNTPIIADVTPYDNSYKNTVARNTWNAPANKTVEKRQNFDQANQVVIEREKDVVKAVDENIIKVYDDKIANGEKISDALKTVVKSALSRRAENIASSVDCSVKCGTIGSPVCSGAYVFTGAGWKDGERSRESNSGGRECTKCGGDGYYDGSSHSCSDLISDGEPVIIPSSVDPTSVGLPAYDAEGKPLKIVSCAEKQGSGWVVSAFGHSGSSDSTKGKTCGIGGNWQEDVDFNDTMNELCAGQDTSYCNSYQASSVTPAIAPSSEATLGLLAKAKLGACNDRVQKNNHAGANLWVKCSYSSISGNVFEYDYCIGGTFDEKGVCSTADSKQEDASRLTQPEKYGDNAFFQDSNDDDEEELIPPSSRTTFDSSDFTPPGLRASQPNDCAFGYTYGDNDKITCAERGDKTADQTADQEKRTEGHDTLADEESQNGLTQALNDSFSNEKLSVDDLNEDMKEEGTFAIIRNWFNKTFSINTSEDDPSKAEDSSQRAFTMDGVGPDLDEESQPSWERVGNFFRQMFSMDGIGPGEGSQLSSPEQPINTSEDDPSKTETIETDALSQSVSNRPEGYSISFYGKNSVTNCQAKLNNDSSGGKCVEDGDYHYFVPGDEGGQVDQGQIPSEEVAEEVVGQASDMTSNYYNPNFNIRMQTGDYSAVNRWGSTVAEWGCVPLTALNFLAYDSNQSNIDDDMWQEVKDNIFWNNGSTDIGSTLALLQNQYGYEGMWKDYESRRIADATEVSSEKYSGYLFYQGLVSEPGKQSALHAAFFDCEEGSCVAIDSNYNSGKPEPCEVSNNGLKCGNSTYEVSLNTGGGPSVLHPYPKKN